MAARTKPTLRFRALRVRILILSRRWETGSIPGKRRADGKTNQYGLLEMSICWFHLVYVRATIPGRGIKKALRQISNVSRSGGKQLVR
jgi:hypothetical protein